MNSGNACCFLGCKAAMNLLLCFFLFIVPGFDGLSADEKRALTNEDVVKMVKAELPESTIILAIRSSTCEFDIRPDALIALKAASVSPKIIEAMLARRAQPQVDAQPRTDNSVTNRDEWPTAYGFYALVAGKLIPLPSAEIQRVFGLGGGVVGDVDAAYAVDGLKDVPDVRTLADSNATFIVYDRDASPSVLKLAELRFVSRMSAWNFNIANTPRQFFQSIHGISPDQAVEVNLLRRTDPLELRVEPALGRPDMYRLTPQRPLRAGASYAFYVGDALHGSDMVFGAFRSQKASSAILFKISAAIDKTLESDTTAWNIIEKGIAAQGGLDQVVKLRKTLTKVKGQLFEKNQEGTYESEVLALYPDRLRQTVNVQLGRRTVNFTLVRNGEKAWKITGGRKQELDDKSRREMFDELYASNLLLELVQRPRDFFTVSQAGTSDVNGRPVNVVNVRSKGHGDMTLFFDQETSLLLKNTYRIDTAAGNHVLKEMLLEDYRETGGLKLPHRSVLFRDGAKAEDSVILTVEVGDAVNDASFNVNAGK